MLKIDIKIGERIFIAREDWIKVVPKDFAQMLGIPVGVLLCYEDGSMAIKPDLLARISEITGKSLQWLCGKDDAVVLDYKKTRGILKEHCSDTPEGD